MMNKTNLKPEWIVQAVRQNPIKLLANGNIITCPVRLSFANILTEGRPPQGSPPGTKGKFGSALLFPPQQAGVDYTPMLQEQTRILNDKFASYRQADGQFYGLHSPFRNQAEKASKYEGYTPGCYFITTTSKFKPKVVDSQMNPIVDENRVYSGVWAICAINAYDFGINPPQPKKGVSFGLQSVMIIADDIRLGGGGSDPNEDFAGVAISPQFNAADQFGQMMPHGAVPQLRPVMQPVQPGFGPGGMMPANVPVGW